MSNIQRIKLPVNEDDHKHLEAKFYNWYINAKPLDKFVYYRGIGLSDTLASECVRKAAWQYAWSGRVYLFCTRDPSDQYYWLYIAQKASRVVPKLNPTKIAQK